MADTTGKIKAFIGTHQKKIDRKGRVTIPQAFRSLLPEESNAKIFLVKGQDEGEYLEAWPAPDWTSKVEKLLAMPPTRKLRKIIRGYVSQAAECSIDREGRIVVPSYFKDFAELKEEVLWVGSGMLMELWSRQSFESNLNIRGEANELLEELDEQLY